MRSVTRPDGFSEPDWRVSGELKAGLASLVDAALDDAAARYVEAAGWPATEEARELAGHYLLAGVCDRLEARVEAFAVAAGAWDYDEDDESWSFELEGHPRSADLRAFKYPDVGPSVQLYKGDAVVADLEFATRSDRSLADEQRLLLKVGRAWVEHGKLPPDGSGWVDPDYAQGRPAAG
jgi:hypothetical protein